MARLLAIDGHSLLNRAYFALPPLATAHGQITNAVYGFMSMFYKAIETYPPDYVLVALDTKGPTFRHKQYEQYKAGRKPMPEDLVHQVPLLKRVLDTLGIARAEKEGVEADDLLGTYARLAHGQGIETLILTGDRDALQLIAPDVHVLLTKRGVSDIQYTDEAALREWLGITPAQVIDMKALMGDSSDNIPGIPGVGEKTALKLLAEYKTLEDVLAAAQDMKQSSLRTKLIEHADSARLSYCLATIDRNVEPPLPLEACAYRTPEGRAVLTLFEQLEFNRLLSKIPQSSDDLPPAPPREDMESFDDIEGFKAALATLPRSDRLAVHIDPAHLEVAADCDRLIRINIIQERQMRLDEMPGTSDVHIDDALAALAPYFKQRGRQFVVYDIKSLMHRLRAHGVEAFPQAFDVMIAAYLLDPSHGQHSLDRLVHESLGEGAPTAACSLLTLADFQRKRLEALGMLPLFSEMEMPLCRVLFDMELAGFKLDAQALRDAGVSMGAQIEALIDQIYQLAGQSFNINSTKQLGEVLFDRLGLPIVKKTRTGYSTDVEVLEKLADRHPIIPLIMEYRQLVKLKSTYIDSLLSLMDESATIHTRFNQTGTATGRLSSNEPNLQNIPVRTEIGKRIRKAFCASAPDRLLVDADYSQIELRVLAHISGDPGMIAAFNQDADIHRSTAAKVYGVPEESVTDAMRSNAKAVNFGIVYGISDFGLARNINVSRQEAADFIERYLNTYPRVRAYMHDVVEQAKLDGYVTTLFNRRRYLPELKSDNFNTRAFGQRVAMNAPIQGTAADIIKLAMVRVDDALAREGLDARLILQVHDELLIDCAIDCAARVEALLVREMESVMPLSVRLKADVRSGRTWFDTK